MRYDIILLFESDVCIVEVTLPNVIFFLAAFVLLSSSMKFDPDGGLEFGYKKNKTAM